jgi:hypothetical protein
MSRAKVIAAIKAAGCDYALEVTWRGWAIVLEAPPGKWFVSSSCSVDCSVWGHGRPDWPLALREVKGIIEQGFCDALEDEADAEDLDPESRPE